MKHGRDGKEFAGAVGSVRVALIGAGGDGLGTWPDGRAVYVAFTLPGELVEVRAVGKRGEELAGEAVAIVEASPDRVAPVCRHFGSCGGCSVQHWDGQKYREWKAGLLGAALRRAGFGEVALASFVAAEAGARRRADLAIRRVGGSIVLGLHRAQSAEVIGLVECPVLHPDLARLLGPLRTCLARLEGLRRVGSAVVNLLDSGADFLLYTDAALTAADRTILADFARAQAMPRISWAPAAGARNDHDGAEPLAALRPARTRLSDAEVVAPPGAFLQASAAGEAAIVAAVLAGLPERLPARAQVAELYAGCGSLTFALARQVRVAAFEGDAPAVAALRTAAGQAGLGGRITITQQDLARRPVLAEEFARFAAIVLDPPFAGAAAQIAQIAASAVRRVIYVSCNPATLARDAAVLRAAGFMVLAATPIDLFLWSARLESVVVFARGK